MRVGSVSFVAIDCAGTREHSSEQMQVALELSRYHVQRDALLEIVSNTVRMYTRVLSMMKRALESTSVLVYVNNIKRPHLPEARRQARASAS